MNQSPELILKLISHANRCSNIKITLNTEGNISIEKFGQSSEDLSPLQNGETLPLEGSQESQQKNLHLEGTTNEQPTKCEALTQNTHDYHHAPWERRASSPIQLPSTQGCHEGRCCCPQNHQRQQYGLSAVGSPDMGYSDKCD